MSGRTKNHSQPAAPNFAPLVVAEVELGSDLPRLVFAPGESGIPYRAAQCLVRLHGAPLGFAALDLPPEGLDAETVAQAVWRQLEAEIRRHLEGDGIPIPDALPVAGLPSPDPPACRAEEERFLSRAPFVSVVIPTRNRPESVARTVAGIAACHYPGDRREVIVVDNGSGSDVRVERSAVEPAEPIALSVVHEPTSGSSNARNRGLLEAGGEIVVFGDDDIDPDRDWIANIVRPFEDPAVAAVGGLTVPNTLETPSQLWFEEFGGFMRGFEHRVFDIADPPSDRPLFPFTVGDYGSGQNMAWRRDVLRGLGGFDPALGPGTVAYDGEDIEAMLRALVAGHRIVYAPEAIVRHEHPREYMEFRRRVWGYGVGLTACMTGALIKNPRLLPALLRKLPRGLAYALSPSSDKNLKKQNDYPAELTRLELRGMAYGPLAYFRGRRRARRSRRELSGT
jgi:GT2 family glycosyltransferase